MGGFFRGRRPWDSSTVVLCRKPAWRWCSPDHVRPDESRTDRTARERETWTWCVLSPVCGVFFSLEKIIIFPSIVIIPWYRSVEVLVSTRFSRTTRFGVWLSLAPETYPPKDEYFLAKLLLWGIPVKSDPKKRPKNIP